MVINHESALRLHAEYTEYILRYRHTIHHYTNRFNGYSELISSDNAARYLSGHSHQTPLPMVSIRMDQSMVLYQLAINTHQPIHYLIYHWASMYTTNAYTHAI